ncbi:MAG: polyprenol monophosphomannose synthase [Phycisphaerales bacterium JB039]
MPTGATTQTTAPLRVDAPPAFPSVTVVIPTYREAENIGPLLERLEAVRAERGLDLDVLFMDDRSGDGSVEAVERAGKPWARFIERDGQRGLSKAVLDGIGRAAGDVIVVMDADLSHPPEKIPELLEALRGADMAIGSRFVPGGANEENWGARRAFCSFVATGLASPLVRVRDPMSGFFAIRRERLGDTGDLDPIGYKIALEIMVRRRLRNIAEVPIRFADRQRGASKLTLREEARRLRHLGRLYRFRLGLGRRPSGGAGQSGRSAS